MRHYLGLSMPYLLPRTILVFTAWGITCAPIMRVWPSAEIPIFAVAGATWLAAGVAYFSYLGKLRVDIVRLERARSDASVWRYRQTDRARRDQRPALFQPRARLP
jgi:hypothetical protein